LIELAEMDLPGEEGVGTGHNCHTSKCVKRPNFKTNTGDIGFLT